MPKLLIDASIPEIDEHFSQYFEITRYRNTDELMTQLPKQDALVCRSYTKIQTNMLKKHRLSVIATASSGHEHIQLTDTSIPVLDAKGANAWAVSDYILCVLAFLKVPCDKTIGIMGYGHVGKTLSKRLTDLNYNIKIHDPFVAIPEHFKANADEIFECPVILIHCNLHDLAPYPTHHLLNRDCFDKMTSDTMVINAARGSIVDEIALLESRWQGLYCTDVYQNEPHIHPDIIHRASICTPHIAGHSQEAKIRITHDIASKLHTFFGLPSRFYHPIEKQVIPLGAWQTAILEQYNPIFETKELKANPSQENFLHLRKKHRRHELSIN